MDFGVVVSGEQIAVGLQWIVNFYLDAVFLAERIARLSLADDQGDGLTDKALDQVITRSIAPLVVVRCFGLMGGSMSFIGHGDTVERAIDPGEECREDALALELEHR